MSTLTPEEFIQFFSDIFIVGDTPGDVGIPVEPLAEMLWGEESSKSIIDAFNREWKRRVQSHESAKKLTGRKGGAK